MGTANIAERLVASTLVAREFFEIARSDVPSKPFTPLQLIKLTYIAHGWSFVNLETPLVSEDVHAWKYGPVFPRLYHAIKAFGSQPVDGVPKSRLETESKTELVQSEKDLIKAVYDNYCDFSGIELTRMTHRHGTPWHKTWMISQNGVVIGNDLIRDYYVGLAHERR